MKFRKNIAFYLQSQKLFQGSLKKCTKISDRGSKY
jgi:hypothetical protein